MKSVLKTLTTLAVIMAIWPFAAQSYEGTRGGGVAVDIQGRPAFRDLIDNTACKWISMAGFINTYAPGANDVIRRIDNVHWVFGVYFKEQLNSVTVCPVEGELKQVNVEDKDGVTVFEREQRQVAIRIENRVWVDMRIFREMPKAHQDALAIHEISHSFIPYWIKMRNNHLRSFVSFVMGPFDAESLAVNIRADELQVPQRANLFPFERSDFERAVSGKGTVYERWLLNQRINVDVAYFKTGPKNSTDHELFWYPLNRSDERVKDELKALEEAIKVRNKELIGKLVSSYGFPANFKFPFELYGEYIATPTLLAIAANRADLFQNLLSALRSQRADMSMDLSNSILMRCDNYVHDTDQSYNDERKVQAELPGLSAMLDMLLREPSFVANLKRDFGTKTLERGNSMNKSCYDQLRMKLCLGAGNSKLRCSLKF